MTASSKIIPVLLAGSLLLHSCVTSTALTSKQGVLSPYYKPLEGWDAQLLSKYNSGTLNAYLAQEISGMGFLKAYDQEFPPLLQSLATASVKAQRTYKAQEVAQAEYDAASARVDSLEAAVAKLDVEIAGLLPKTSQSEVAHLVDAKERRAEQADTLKLAQADRDEKHKQYLLGKAEYGVVSAEFKATFLGSLYLAQSAHDHLRSQAGADSTNENASELDMLKRDWRMHALAQYAAVLGLGELAGMTGTNTGRTRYQFSFTSATDLDAFYEKIAQFDSFGVAYLDRMTDRRNEILAELFVLAEAVHKTRDYVLVYGRAKANVFFESIRIAATAVASVTGSGDASRKLAAFATGIAALQESVDKELFFKQNTTALLLLMQADREKHKMPLVRGMAKDADEYSLAQSIKDFVPYLTAGGLTDAISRLSKEAAAGAETANTALQKLEEDAAANLSVLEQAKKAEAARKKAQLNALIERASETLGLTPLEGPEE